MLAEETHRQPERVPRRQQKEGDEDERARRAVHPRPCRSEEQHAEHARADDERTDGDAVDDIQIHPEEQRVPADERTAQAADRVPAVEPAGEIAELPEALAEHREDHRQQRAREADRQREECEERDRRAGVIRVEVRVGASEQDAQPVRPVRAVLQREIEKS